MHFPAASPRREIFLVLLLMLFARELLAGDLVPVRFASVTNITSTPPIHGLSYAADLTGDGLPDIIGKGGQLIVYRQMSNLVFDAWSTNNIPQLLSTPREGLLMDANRDGWLDYLTIDYANNAFKCYTNRAGSFTLSQHLNTGSGPHHLALLDVTEDGISDLVLPIFNGRRINVYWGTGFGSFQPYNEYDVGNKPYSVATGDIDIDGNVDIIVVNSETNGSITILYGTAVHGFSAPITRPVPRYANSLAISDFDSNGFPDVAIAVQEPTGIVVLLTGHGRTIIQSNFFPVPLHPSNMLAADLNNDGALDLMPQPLSRAGAVVLLSHGDGTFTDPIALAHPSEFTLCAVEDLDLDGRIDLIGADSNTGVGAILRNTTMPKLAAVRTDSTLNLSWSASLGTHFKLEGSAGGFNSNEWNQVEAAISLNSNIFSIGLPITGSHRFFQLSERLSR